MAYNTNVNRTFIAFLSTGANQKNRYFSENYEDLYGSKLTRLLVMDAIRSNQQLFLGAWVLASKIHGVNLRTLEDLDVSNAPTRSYQFFSWNYYANPATGIRLMRFQAMEMAVY